MFSLIIAFVVIVVVDSTRASRHFPNSLPTARQPVKWVVFVKRREIFHNHSGGVLRNHNLQNQECQRTNVRVLLVNNMDSLPTYLERILNAPNVRFVYCSHTHTHTHMHTNDKPTLSLRSQLSFPWILCLKYVRPFKSECDYNTGICCRNLCSSGSFIKSSQ